MSHPPTMRVRTLAEAPPRLGGAFVLYWMTATRRLEWNYALDHAVTVARSLGKPLLIYEGLELGYRWASDRHHQAIMDGMREHSTKLSASPVGYFPFIERSAGEGRGLVRALAARACHVVTDDSPVFFTPKLLEAASRLEGVRVDAVDSVGLLPIRAAGRPYSAAYHFRRYLHKELPARLGDVPSADPLTGIVLPPMGELPTEVAARWAPAEPADFEDPSLLASLPIDHSVGTTPWRGGASAARSRLQDFVEASLPRYVEDRNHPDSMAPSGLSPWLHYGHISPHEIFRAVVDAEEWTPIRLSDKPDGRRSGWWGMSASAEAFLDQLITWREVGHGYAVYEPDFTQYETLPAWARQTLEDHVHDRREHLYSADEFAAAETHDEIWNAAQRQLVEDGYIHNYLRMLWGKKILEWTEHPREALDVMVEINNRYALDGRDPNSYSGIFWVMGRFDRGWPERPIFGKVRSMTSASTRRKLSLDRYLERWGGPSAQLTLDGAGHATA
ncbi:MAG: deoxyribodipyrimidine photolyase [Gemmatimonadetes bacterium]|nr:deoxyribodipyrimidine photolyase [Gemmatimonadota bacterium]MDA1104115.1 deoxyribodipyrimidine photolyase [Gemmatimonadota bacterium]